MDDDNENDKEPATKRLRYSEPDLKIVIKYCTTAPATTVGTRDDNGSGTSSNDEEEEHQHHEKEYLMYSSHVAHLSKFVDPSLSIEMKEKQTKVIEFHDVTPEIFELALKFEQDTIAARSMNAKEAVAVVEFYDKYEFTGGLALCDRVMSEFVKNGLLWIKSAWPVDIDDYIDVLLLAVKLDLKETKPICLGAFTLMFRTHNYFAASRFSLEQLVKLHPLLKEQVIPLPRSMKVSSEELNSPLFPRFCWEYIRNHTDQPTLTSVCVKGAGEGPSAQYFGYYGSSYRTKTPTTWQGKEVYFEMENDDNMGGDWVISAVKATSVDDDDDDDNDPDDDDEDNRWILWRSPFSHDLQFPPKKQWLPVHPLAGKKEPTLEYAAFYFDGTAFPAKRK